MAGPTAKRRATYEDLMAVPDHKVAEIMATHSEDVLVRAEPFETTEIGLKRLWGR